MDSQMFINTPPTKLFFRCAIPAVVTSVFGALYSVVDGIFVGRYLGEDALAAINFIMPIIMIVEAISNMIATGASVNMSMLLGAQKREEASRVFSFSVKFILAFSFVISVLGFFFARPFICLISPGATEAAIRCGTDYLKVFALFGPLIPIYFATDNYLRVCGKQKLSMIIGVVTQLLNVVLDFLFIAVLHKGVRAAAVASFTALDRPVRSLLVSFFGTLIFPIAFLFLLTAIWGLNGVWLMASAAAVASGILTLILAKTLKLEKKAIITEDTLDSSTKTDP